MRGSGSFENQKERFHPGHHQQLILGPQRPVEIGEALPSHRVPRPPLLADAVPGLVVTAPEAHA